MADGGATIYLAAAAAAAAVGGVAMQHQQAQAVERGQKKEARIERRISAIENARRARRAVAQARLQRAELEAGGASAGLRNSSAITGAVGSLFTQTGSEIGAAATRNAANIAQNKAAIHSAGQAATFGTIASGFNAAASILGTAAFSGSFGKQPTANPVPTANQPVRQAPAINPTVTIRN